MFNAIRCEPYLQPPAGERIQTTARIVAGIVQCLAEGHPPLPEAYDFGAIVQIDAEERFENYVYE